MGASAGATQAGRIGPNAVLQLVPVLDRAGGRDLRARLIRVAGLSEVPDGTAMLDEMAVARLHQAMRTELPAIAPGLARAAGRRTGDYIRINRIPRGAQALLHLLPARLAAPLLARAIAAHAWTFAGSGRFRIAANRPLTFEIDDNPLVRGERSDCPLCDWHAAVFERLFTRLVDPRLRCREVACCAMGAPACRFEIARTQPARSAAIFSAA